MPLIGERIEIEKPVKNVRTGGYFAIGYLLVVILCANDFLYLGAWTHIEGRFNIRDIGNLMILLGAVVLLMRRLHDSAVKTPMSILIILYLFMVAVQVAVATIVYHQPLIQGALSGRHQLYYLSFFLFLLVLDTPEKITRFLNLITLLALIIIILSVINYIGPTLYVHKWAEGHGERAGVTRAFIPAMNILGVAALWEISKLSEKGRTVKGGIASVILFAAHVFRQTRMRTVGLIGVVLFILVQRRKWGTLSILATVCALGISILEIGLDIPILTSQFTTAFENVKETEGSWYGRKIQLDAAIDEFLEHPVIGSGAGVLRADEAADYLTRYNELFLVAAKADLGYASWLKSYGVVGMLWLMFFYFIWWKNARKAKNMHKDHAHLTSFIIALLIWLAGTFITLNHFMDVSGIVVICMGAAIAVRLACFKNRLMM